VARGGLPSVSCYYQFWFDLEPAAIFTLTSTVPTHRARDSRFRLLKRKDLSAKSLARESLLLIADRLCVAAILAR
jgi:hypothetical protein